VGPRARLRPAHPQGVPAAPRLPLSRCRPEARPRLPAAPPCSRSRPLKNARAGLRGGPRGRARRSRSRSRRGRGSTQAHSGHLPGGDVAPSVDGFPSRKAGRIQLFTNHS
jgi:hypothetical protein